jgi:hypothetical protein
MYVVSSSMVLSGPIKTTVGVLMIASAFGLNESLSFGSSCSRSLVAYSNKKINDKQRSKTLVEITRILGRSHRHSLSIDEKYAPKTDKRREHEREGGRLWNGYEVVRQHDRATRLSKINLRYA